MNLDDDDLKRIETGEACLFEDFFFTICLALLSYFIVDALLK